MWLEQIARKTAEAEPYPFPFADGELDFRPLLGSLARDVRAGQDPAQCARAFQCGLAHGLCQAIAQLCEQFSLDTAVLSGGVFQNELLLHDIQICMLNKRVHVWTNSSVPPNDGGISLGQCALAAFRELDA